MKVWHWIVLAVVLAASVVVSMVADAEHFPAFYAVFGFVGAVFLLVLAKAVGKKLLMRREDYYDER